MAFELNKFENLQVFLIFGFRSAIRFESESNLLASSYWCLIDFANFNGYIIDLNVFPCSCVCVCVILLFSFILVQLYFCLNLTTI